MKVLIVKVSALGDVVHALPVLSYLHRVVPDLQLDWLVEKGFAAILEPHPLIRKVYQLDTRGWRREGAGASIRGALAVARQLRRERYDAVLDLQGNSKSGLFTWMSGAARRYGFDRSQAREWPNLLATNHKVTLPSEVHQISQRYLEIARNAFPSAESVPGAGPLPVPEAVLDRVAGQVADAGLNAGHYIVAHYGTTWDTKLWALSSWQELVRRLVESGQRVVLTWGNEEERRAAEAIHDASEGRALVWPRGSLMELVALLKLSRLVIGADTGPIHIAAAVDTPTVSLFRVTDALRNGPEGRRHVRLQAPLDCSPCLRKQCERDTECSRSISVDTVYQEITSLLNLC